MHEFGRSLRDNEFMLDKDTVLINHGSWGTVPRRVFEERLKLMRELECNPDHWYRRTLEDRWTDNLSAAAEFLGADPKDTVFVINATIGVNCVVKSVPLHPGDAILVQSYTYNAINKVAQAAADKAGCEVLTLVVPMEISSTQQIIDKYREMLQKHSNIKLVILDYISSSTGTLFPIKEIVPLCKSHDALVMLDAAHTPGHLPVNMAELSELGVDFYTGNLHKWLFTPRGCALLWIHPKHQKTIHPAITSHCYKDPVLQKNFFNQGTKDDTPFLCAKTAIQFYKDIGGLEKIHAYCTNLLDEAVAMLVSAWGTQKQKIPCEMEAPFMRLVQVPDMATFPVANPQAVFGDMNHLMTVLHHRFKVCCTVQAVWGRVWVRLSGFVYNTMQDYERLRDAILVLKRESENNSQ